MIWHIFTLGVNLLLILGLIALGVICAIVIACLGTWLLTEHLRKTLYFLVALLGIFFALELFWFCLTGTVW